MRTRTRKRKHKGCVITNTLGTRKGSEVIRTSPFMPVLTRNPAVPSDKNKIILSRQGGWG